MICCLYATQSSSIHGISCAAVSCKVAGGSNSSGSKARRIVWASGSAFTALADPMRRDY
jgi:hypothetical protein